ncbi:MAG: hypothetical protein IJS47_04995, partial [Clostridia bacterium]|nr:hypothetical protein [Clostridia bacterium]
KTLLRVKQGNKSKSGWNKVKASALRRWLVIRLIAAVQTTRFTGGHDLQKKYILFIMKQRRK